MNWEMILVTGSFKNKNIMQQEGVHNWMNKQ